GACLQPIGASQHVVAAPADAASDVQQDLLEELEYARNLVCDGFGRMEMAGVEAEEFLTSDGVAEIEFVGTHGATFRADAEELGFDGVEVEPGRERFVEDG